MTRPPFRGRFAYRSGPASADICTPVSASADAPSRQIRSPSDVPLPPAYLDNAATTWPKPPQVGEAMLRALEEAGGNPGRSGHRLSLAAAELIYTCRCEAADFFHSDHPEYVVFTQNATYALNLAIKGMATDGSHILFSEMEHNSVRRPVAALAYRGIHWSTYEAGDDETQVLASIRSRLRRNTRIIVAMHGSNICNLRLPIRAIGTFCRAHGLLFIVDASQTAGHADLNLAEDGIDALCMPGHKGLYGPPGSGLLLLSERGARQLTQNRTWVEGGSGSASREITMPEALPERLEAGTASTPAIAGLLAGIRFVREEGPEAIAAREDALRIRTEAGLAALPGVTLYRPGLPGSIVLFNLRDTPAEEVCRILDASGICVRAGLHCAPGAHTVLRTGEGGAVRVSFGAFNTEQDVERLLLALKAKTC